MTASQRLGRFQNQVHARIAPRDFTAASLHCCRIPLTCKFVCAETEPLGLHQPVRRVQQRSTCSSVITLSCFLASRRFPVRCHHAMHAVRCMGGEQERSLQNRFLRYMSQRAARARSLYRRILRAARDWQPEEVRQRDALASLARA